MKRYLTILDKAKHEFKFGLWIWLGGLSVLAGWSLPLAAKPLRFCFEDVPQRPWTFPDGTGLNFVVLNEVEKQLGEQFVKMPLPWKRCLAYVENGEADGAIGAAITPERTRFAKYPQLPNGNERASASLNFDDFSIFVLNNSKIEWNGKTFSNLKGIVAIQAGYFVANPLQAMGLRIDQSGKSAEHGLRLVLSGNADAAVLEHGQSDYLVHKDSRFQGKIKSLPLPFAKVPLYLTIGKPCYQSDPKRIEQIWDAIETVRKSKKYRQQEKEAMQQDQEQNKGQ